MKITTTLRKPQFRRFMLLGSALAGLALSSARSQVTVEVIHYFNTEGQLAALNEMQKEFEAANPDIKLRFTYVPFGELVSRTLQMAAVRKPPAISAIDNPDVLRVAKAGILKDISADVAKIKVWEDIYPGPKAAVSDGSKVFGMPIGSNSLALYYNKKMLTDAGVTSPPQDLGRAYRNRHKDDQKPGLRDCLLRGEYEEATWQWEPFLWSNGGSLTDLGSENAKEALQLWVDWVKKGVASKDVVNWNQGDVPNQFLGGRAATMVMGPWQLANVKKSGIDFGIVTIPVPKEGEKPVVPLGGEVWCVLKGDSKVEAGRGEVRRVHAGARAPSQDLRHLQLHFVHQERRQATGRSQCRVAARLWTKWRPLAPGRRTAERSIPRSPWRHELRFSRALTGEASAEAALKEAAAKIKDILAKK